jgi:GMP synthase (glutamine-hydrolysing)
MEDRKEQIIILDLGSQYTQIIAREILRAGVKSKILKTNEIEKYLEEDKPKGIILSGGASSVYDGDAPFVSENIFSIGIPVLGICFGMQYLAYRENKNLVTGVNKSQKEYGPIEIEIMGGKLMHGLDKKLKVWASHGDIVNNIPDGFVITAKSQNVIEAMENEKGKLYAVQFHPEVIETEDDNTILRNFVFNICNCVKDWEAKNTIEEIRKEVLEKTKGEMVAIGVSGGVDSTTLAGVLAPVLKEKLFSFFIDTGAMRMNEVEEVKEMCQKSGINLYIVDAHKEFLDNLKNETDAEEKRALFKETYQSIYKKIIENNNIKYILQGTLATDLIESGHKGNAQKIKSHHNVGLDFEIKEISPFAHLFKHEVREIARSIGLEKEISERKPFPGPGLYVRVVGMPVTEENIEKIRIADDIVNKILKKEDFYGEISQIVVAILGIKTVGVQGDSRSYNHPIVVRCVSTTDFMTVKGFEIPSEVKKKIISEITKHGFNRVFFDETPKPPATTELE